EQLSILRAWAKVYICAIEQWKKQTTSTEESSTSTNNSLLVLVEPSLSILIKHWFAVLRDFSILSLPQNILDDLKESGFDGGGTFFTADSIECCKEHYYTSWPLILLACSVWMRYGQNLSNPKDNEIKEKSNFHLILGICMDFLSNNSKREDERPIQLCLSSIENLLECEKLQLELMTDIRMPIELLNVLYKWGGEGVGGIFDPSTSLVFALLESIMCILARQIPQVNLPQAKVRILTPLQTRKCGHLSTESDELIHSTVDLLPQLTSFCCTDGIMVILPSLLNLLFGILRECSSQEDDNNQQQSKAISSAILALKKLCSECPHPTKEQKLFEAWESIIRGGLLSLLNFANESHQSGHKEQQLTLLLSAAVILSSASTAKPKTIKNGKEEGDELSTTFRV
uniref:Uncharacterized protein n=1 Tax=Meloidogyne floridensis TaxID=298350 RepID=A0A915P3I8_9BILA